MANKTLGEIETEIESSFHQGDIGAVLQLTKQHSKLLDRMKFVIYEGDINEIRRLEDLGMDFTTSTFVKEAVAHDQRDVICHLVSKGADIDNVIELSKQLKNEVICIWAELYKYNRGRSSK